MGCSQSKHKVQTQQTRQDDHNGQECEIDKRLPLDDRQVFKLKQSWKGIRRNMEDTGMEMFPKICDRQYMSLGTGTSQQKRQGEAEKTYEEINWDELFENNLIEKQTVATLDKYIEHHKLGVYHYKAEKTQAVKRNIATMLIALDKEQIQSDEEDDLAIRA
ncbi:unnamed protein product [Mytilus coruscus]|uniref:Uncharacterized protein n=1 Tax=Mytilus coruscus TaxID=42192 RepID=A0A6J8AI58_MYTCO|nr:unnamed protein product [Mytilus coruscus]